VVRIWGKLRECLPKANALFEGCLQTLFPARCPACQEPVGRHGGLCAPCWDKIHFITAPMCHRCGLPFDYQIAPVARCARCLRDKPPYRQARAVFRYTSDSRAQLLALKYQDKTQLAPIFSRWLHRASLDLPRCDLILPVPLHYFRLVRRRYNQAALLARGLSRLSGVPVRTDLLKRVRATPSQAGLSRSRRQANLRGAFHVPEKRKDQLRHRTVLLIDDVLTTGATIHACCRALKDAGVKDVYVLTLARVVLVGT
jgi:ComF family protein